MISFKTKNNKTRRARRTKAKQIIKSLRCIGINAAGLKPKIVTFKKVLNELQPAVFFIQESKIKKEGKLNFENYELFEMSRETKEGGGLLIGCIKDLKPVLVRKGTDDTEVMSVDIFVKTMKIRCVVAYGCQENSLVEKKLSFWKFIEEEAMTAQNSGSGFIMQFDGNLWAGSNLVPGDPRPQNKNGKLFGEFLSRQKQLTIVNSLPLCEGLITRMRVKDGKAETSILDFFVVCSRVLPYVSRMKIDDDKKYILTNYKPARKGEKATDTDHFTEILDINLDIVPGKPKRREIFRFKDKKAQELFKEKTSNTKEFSRCFQNDKSIQEQIIQWRHILNSHCKNAFKKIRINPKKKMKPLNPKISSLIDDRNKLVKKMVNGRKCAKAVQQEGQMSIHTMNHTHNEENYCESCAKEFKAQTKFNMHIKQIHEVKGILKCYFCADEFGKASQLKNHLSYHKLKNIENEIATLQAEENRKLVMKKFKKFSENSESVNLQEIWKLLKSICPKFKNSVPMAKRDHQGNIITNQDEIKKLLAKEYKQRLRSRPKRFDLYDIETRRKEIFDLQMKLAEKNKSQEWKISDLEIALKGLKNNKSRDHAGFLNEIFKPGVIGSDLKVSLLTMFNHLKNKNLIPDFMKFANITTVPKKGSLLELENERGIFRVDVVRSILMKMIYNQNYPNIDNNMSDGQMGGRKRKGSRNNIFMINGIIHDVMSSKNKKPIILQIYDYSQMFDSIDLKQAISDIYEAGLTDNNLSLLYKANSEIFMAVKTPSGNTERQKIANTVLQGDTFGSLLASVQVDSIAQECSKSGYGYNYMEKLPVAIFGLVDDTVTVTEAGYKAHAMNVIMNIKTAEKGLQFGAKKCKTMLVGRNTKDVLNPTLRVDTWSVEHRWNEERGDTDLVEKYAGQVNISSCKEQKYLGFVLSCDGSNIANIRSIRNKANGIIRQIFQKLKELNLQKYFFECGMLLMNAILRSSILYASETYYNLKEIEIRQLERIEENFMRQLLKTKKSCPITQIYTELGQIPARFDIIKLRLLFLKYILDQDRNSSISKMYHLQLENPRRGDWASSCKKNLQYLKIELSNEEIRKMSKLTYKNIVRKKCKERAFEYLLSKRGKKGQNIEYKNLRMAEYFLPNEELTIEEQRNIFEIRNMMTNIPSNYISKKANTSRCICGEIEDIEHIYYCRKLNTKEPEVEYKEINGDNLKELKYIQERIEENMKEREISQEILYCDPLLSVKMDCSNG